jgi:hypothetical protein
MNLIVSSQWRENQNSKFDESKIECYVVSKFHNRKYVKSCLKPCQMKKSKMAQVVLFSIGSERTFVNFDQISAEFLVSTHYHRSQESI